MTTESQLTQAFILSGIPIAPFRELIHQAVINSWSHDELMFHVVMSPAFESAFPGIKRDDGSLKMDPATYRATVDTYTHTAYLLGYTPSAEMIGGWIGNDVSPQEVADRYSAANRIKESPEAFAALQKEWSAAGLGKISEAQVANALLGQAPKEFYDIWERVNLRTAAANAGTYLTHAEAARIQAVSPETLTESGTQATMADLANQLRTTMPLSRLYAQHGLTRSDLITLEFGGPGQADIRIRAEKALATAKAQSEPRATPYAGALTGAPRTVVAGSGGPQTA